MPNIYSKTSESNPQIRPDGPPDGPTVGDIKVRKFVVSPSAIKAGDLVGVSWATTIPPYLPGVKFYLNGLPVGSSGNEGFKPIATTTYSLIATAGGWLTSLASGTVTVDTSACNLDNGWSVRDLQTAILQPQVFAKLRKSENFQISGPGPIVINLWLNEQTDLTFEYEAATGLIKLVLPLGVSLNVAPGEGSVTLTAWYTLATQDGLVVPVSQKLQTDLSLPWAEWGFLLSLILGPGAAALLTGVLYGVAPSLLGNAGTEVTGAISTVFSLFKERCVAVRLDPNPDDSTNPIIVATSCP